MSDHSACEILGVFVCSLSDKSLVWLRARKYKWPAVTEVLVTEAFRKW